MGETVSEQFSSTVVLYTKLTECLSALAAHNLSVPAILYHLSKACPGLVQVAERVHMNVWRHVADPSEYGRYPARIKAETMTPNEIKRASLLLLFTSEFEDECP